MEQFRNYLLGGVFVGVIVGFPVRNNKPNDTLNLVHNVEFFNRVRIVGKQTEKMGSQEPEKHKIDTSKCFRQRFDYFDKSSSQLN